MVKKFFYISTFIISILSLFTSCDGFMQGNKLQNELNALVDYANQPEVTINFSQSGGSISPVGDQTYKVTQKFSVICTEKRDSKNCFVKWTVKNKKTNHIYTDSEITNFLAFDDINSADTKVQVLSSVPDILIEAKCVNRPVIATQAPSYSPDGVYRDRRIDVMFTKQMDESSIYYSENEKSQLISMNYLPLTDSKRNNKCYGYKDSSGNIHFKNIKISKRTDDTVNLLKYYEAPYFDETDASVLRINASSTVSPPVATDIYITIEKDMFYKDTESNVNVCLQDDFSWSYYTNSLTDDKPPKFITEGTTAFNVYFGKDNQVDFDNNTSIPSALSTFSSNNKANYKNNNLKNNKLWVKGMFSDGESGPSNIEWHLYKINSTFYPQSSTKEVTKGNVDSLIITGSNAKIGTVKADGNSVDGMCIDLSKYATLEEGLYKISFICNDKNGRSSTAKDYYFVHDVTPPKNFTVNYEHRYAADKATLNCKNSNYDVDKVTIKSRNTTNTSKSTLSQDFTSISNNQNNDFVVTNLITKNKYAHSFVLTDICGNEKTYPTEEFIDNSVTTNYSTIEVVTSYATDIADVKLKNDSPNYSYSIINGINFTNDSTKKIDNNQRNSNRKQTITITDYDFSDNPRSYTKEIYTTPSVGMIVYSDKYWSDTSNRPSGKNAAGVICNTSNLYAVKVWDLVESTGFCWGGDQRPNSAYDLTNFYTEDWVASENAKRKYPHGSGLLWYNLILGSYSETVYYTHDGYGTIWNYLVNKNNAQRQITWYAPGLEECKYILDNYDAMIGAYTALGKTLITVNQPYWTGMPRNNRSYAYVGSFGSDQISAGTDWKLYVNNNSTLKAFWCTSDGREGNWYKKWNWHETYNASSKQAIYFHAMGQVDLH